ncbi:hypothetical protein Tco_0784397 [Tanacetum coccineum]
MYSTVLPPKLRKMLGRPKKKRIRTIGDDGSSTRVSKVGSRGSCSNCKKLRHNKSSYKEPVVEQIPKPKGVVGKPRKKQPIDDFKEVDVVQRGSLRDEGASGTRGDTIGSRDRGGKKMVRTSGFAKWFGLQDEPEQTQAAPQQTQHKPEQTQVEDQVEQTEDQAEIDLTQLEQTQEPTQDQVQEPTQKLQEQPQQAALRMSSARILQRKLGKQGSSQNTTLNLD